MSRRSHLNLADDVNYLNVAYLAPQLRVVQEVASRALERLAEPWTIRTEDFFAPCATLRQLGAELVGATPKDIAIVPSVSYGIATAAAAIPLRKGQEVVVLKDQFPSNYYPWERRCQEMGASLRVVEWGRGWTEGILASLSPQVAVVAVPQVHWTDCSEVDLAAVSAACRDIGASLVVDGTQSVGASPFSVPKIRPDFLVWALYKWCFGPFGTTLMYVDPRWQGARPIEEGWLNRRGSEDFSALVDYQRDYVEGAPRFDMGQKGQFLGIPMASAALEQILHWQPERVEAHNKALTDLLAAAAQERGWGTPRERGKHFIGLELGGDLSGLGAHLAKHQIYASVRGTRLRVAPHLHTSVDEIQSLIESLDSLPPVSA